MLSGHVYHPQQNQKKNLGDILHPPYDFLQRVYPQTHQTVPPVFLPKTFTKIFKRPRCAIPTTTSCIPLREAWRIISFIIGIKASEPSREKRLAPGNFAPR